VDSHYKDRGNPKSYATVVLTRAPLTALEAAEVQALEQASQQHLGLALSAYQTADNSACLNRELF
jgi:hypothetical protein